MGKNEITRGSVLPKKRENNKRRRKGRRLSIGNEIKKGEGRSCARA
jgi:hypothetical protein